ncbi:unnamed protein product [Mytilus edulis]|uniref:B box-type domain-containing protein n=1 Tax=Mytilus edulis TaxID=6550 RepID=A0A8S3VBJ1_MYTED|nr:unnamed protein product [Mytilus edulis]
MASNILICRTCYRRSKTTEAVKYCTDCEDGFCSECLDFHENMEVATSHHVIDIVVVDEITFNISKFCKVHSDMVLEYFCSDHDALCCRSCMASYHRSCDKLLPVDVAAKGVKSSTMYEEIVTDVNTLNITVNELAGEKEKSVSTLDDSKVTVQQEVQCFQKKLETRIQEIGVALMCEVDEVHTELSDKTKVDMEKIFNRRKQIRNISEQFESVSKHGSDSQIFMLMNNIKEELNCHINEFQEFLSSQNAVSLCIRNKGHKLADILMYGRQWGITMEEDKNTAWVTLPDTPCVQAVDIIKMEKGRHIKVPGKCNDIALIGDEIAVGGINGNIYIINKTGNLMKTIKVERSDVHSLSVGLNHQLYYAQADIAKSKLKCVRLDDGTVTSISTQCTNNVIDVKADRLGNVCILECNTSNFKLLCSDDKSLKTMLTTEDGLTTPYGFAFSTDLSKLFISNYVKNRNSEILVYDCN